MEEIKVTSKNTSINKRVPAIASLLEKNVAEYVLDAGIYDLGCGKYPEYFSDWCTERGIPYKGEDKHQFEGIYNNQYAFAMSSHPCAISSNVLNVLPPQQREEYLCNLLTIGISHYRMPSWIFITVYEGDKTGVGKYRKDSYQANMKTEDMRKWVENVFPFFKWERKGKLIFCKTGAEI